MEPLSLGDLSEEIEELAHASQESPTIEVAAEANERPNSLSDASWAEATRAQQ